MFNGRAYIPPAPLRLLSADFGTGFDRNSLTVTGPTSNVQPASSVRIVGLTSIYAPLGLREQVSHQWYLDGGLAFGSPFYQVTGGRKEGFRLWTGQVFDLTSHRAIRLDVVTEGGQLIGRAFCQCHANLPRSDTTLRRCSLHSSWRRSSKDAGAQGAASPRSERITCALLYPTSPVMLPPG